MPNFDGTGPAGMGPKTGRQRGRCGGANLQEKESRRGRRNGNRQGRQGL